MTDEEYARCERVLESVHRLHNWRHYATQAGIIRGELFVEVRFRGDMATFDGDELTRLVLAAHREQVRAGLHARCKGVLTLHLHPRNRQPEGSLYARHPDLGNLARRAARMSEAVPLL